MTNGMTAEMKSGDVDSPPAKVERSAGTPKRKAKRPRLSRICRRFVSHRCDAKCARTASAALAPTTRTSSSRVARRTPARLPKAVSSAFRRLGPMPDNHVQIRSQVALRPRLPVERHGEPVRLVADPLDEQQRRALARQRDRHRRGRA